MLNVKKLCQDFEDCIGWKYVSPGGTGKDCSKTGIDCSGMFVRAYKLQGASIYHGSNTIYRKYCSDQKKLTSTSQLFVGAAVFKWNANTPSKFNDNLGDFQHIGLVTSVKPLRIVHASTQGYVVRVDSSIGKWKYVAKLKAVDYGTTDKSQATQPDSEDKKMTGKVTTPNGGKVNIRKNPTTAAAILNRANCGAVLTVLGETKGWYKVKIGSTVGYVSAEYIELVDEEAKTEQTPSDSKNEQDVKVPELISPSDHEQIINCICAIKILKEEVERIEALVDKLIAEGGEKIG